MSATSAQMVSITTADRLKSRASDSRIRLAPKKLASSAGVRWASSRPSAAPP